MAGGLFTLEKQIIILRFGIWDGALAVKVPSTCSFTYVTEAVGKFCKMK